MNIDPGTPMKYIYAALWCARRYKAFLIIHSLIILSVNTLGQCPGTAFFKSKINHVYNSPVQKNDRRLFELLKLRQNMEVCHLEKDSAFMFLLQKIGVLSFRLGNYTGAIQVTKEALQIAKVSINRHPGYTLALVHNYSNLFYYYSETGESKNKYSAIDSCIVYALRGGDGFDLAIAPLADKTDYLFNKGEYSLCTKNARLGENIIQKYYHEKDSIEYMVFFIMKQANALYVSKDISGAGKLLENKILQFKQTGNSKQLYAFYSLLGLINRDKKNYAKALTCFQEAFRGSFTFKFRQGCAQSLAFIATLYQMDSACGNYDSGLVYCARALQYADKTDSLFILRQKANLYSLKRMYDTAHFYFQQAYNTVQYGMNDTKILQSSFQSPGFNQLQDLSDLATDKGHAFMQQYYYTKNIGYLKQALTVYKNNDLFLAKIKTEQQLEFASNLVWRTSARHLYEFAIEACYAGNNIENAFYFFEKSRAVLLNDQINEQRWLVDKDIAKQAIIKKNIIGLERDLESVPAASREYLNIQNKLGSSRQELRLLTGNIKNKNLLFYQNYLDTTFLTLDQVQKTILHNRKTLLEIFYGDSAVYVLTVSPNHKNLTRINKQLYDSLTHSFNSYITKYNKLNVHFKEYVNTAYQLYTLLFKGEKPGYGSIIISPDGVGFPFEALVVNENEKQPDYFLNYYATSYTYSVKYLTNQFATNSNKASSLLGIAPVQFKKYPNLAELEGSDQSLQNIHKYFSKATTFILKEATKNNFLVNFPAYSVIQLYTHAADNSSNNDPVIYFSDSNFYLSDLITDRKPITQLVVLSACETAMGKSYEGEGIFSFNRGFAALGIPAAVSNLWAVDNKSTYRLTELFYKYLSKGLSTDVALQQAKIAFIKTSSSKGNKLPYFWAGPILTGKVDSIANAGSFPWFTLSAAVILVVLMVFGKRYFIKEKAGQI